MKSIKRPSKKKKYLVILFAVILVATGGYLAYAAIAKTGPFAEPDDSTVNYDQPTDEEKEAGNRTSDEAKQPEPEPTNPEKPTEEPDTPTQPDHVGVTITAASQNGSTLQVRATISTLKSGTCTLTMTKSGSNTITKTATTQPLANSSTCQGFNIPVGSVDKGEWLLKISYSSSNTSGSATKTITIN